MKISSLTFSANVLSAFICPDGEDVVVVEDDNIQLDLDVPGNDGVNPDDAVTSAGIDISPTDSLEVTPPQEGDTIRVMDVEFKVLGADTVTVTFTIPGGTDKVIEVSIFTCHCVVT